MASVTPTFADIGGDDNAILVTWNLTTANADGLPVEMIQYRDLCWQSFATTQSTAVATIQGSNDGTNWFSVRDPGGTAMTFSADGGKQQLERPRYVRPNLTTGGTLAVIAVTVTAIRNPLK